MTEKEKAGAIPAGEPAKDAHPHPRQSPYGHSENYGSPGGDEPPASTDPGSGSATDAGSRHERPTSK